MRKQFDIFSNRNFSKYVVARFFFISSLYMQATIILWEIYRLTNDALSLGVIGLAEFIPAFFSTFYAGHVIDTKNKKKVLLFSVFSYFICSLLLIAISIADKKGLTTSELVTFFIYTVVFLTGIFRSFSGPGFFSFLSEIVEKKDYVTASNWHSNSWQIASVVGPAVGGLVYSYFGLITTLSIVSILLISSWFLISSIHYQPAKRVSLREKFLKNIFLGLAYIFRKKVVFQILLLDLLTVLFAGATALLPIFSKDILQVGTVGLGLLRSSISLGAIVMITLLTLFPMKRNQGKKMLFAVIGFGIAMVVFALSKNFYLSLATLFFSGVFDSISVIVRSNILQVTVPQKFKGRVSSANTLFVMSSNELGALESGITAKYLGAVNSVLLGGTVSIIIGIQTLLKSKKIKRLTY